MKLNNHKSWFTNNMFDLNIVNRLNCPINFLKRLFGYLDLNKEIKNLEQMKTIKANKNIKNKYEKKERLINILIRNTYRPNSFKKCISSILNQKPFLLISPKF